MFFCCCQFQQVVSSFFRDHSRLVAKWPLPFLVGPVLITLILTAALVLKIDRLEETPKEDRLMLFLPEDVPSMRNLRTLKQLFPPKDPLRDTYDVFRRAFAFVILEDLSQEKNVLRNPVLKAAADLHRRVKNLRVELGWLSASYNQLCARKQGACIEHPIIVLLNGSDPLSVIQYFLRYPYFDVGNQTVDNTHIFGSVRVNSEGFLTSAQALRIPYLLHESEIFEEKYLVYLWQKEFLKLMKNLRYRNIAMHYISSVSWAEEVDRNGNMLLPYLPLLCATLLIFSVFACFTTDCVLSKPWVGLCGVLNALFAVIATLGTLIYCGYPFLQMVFIMPFLIISISVDNMFLMLSSWRATHPLSAVEDRMAHAIGDTAVSIMITALTDGLSFSVGSISQFPAVRIFCTYCALAVLYVFFYQMTFFMACMALTGRREAANRHCITFAKIKPKSQCNSESCFYRAFCAGGYHSPGDRRIPSKIETQFLTEFLSTFYADLISHWAIKGLVLMLYVIYLGVSVYGIIHLPLGLNLRTLVPHDSYAAREFETSTKHFSAYGSYAYAVIMDKNLPYESRDANTRLQNLYFALSHTEFTTEGEFWLKDLNSHVQNAVFPNKFVFMDQLHEFLKLPRYRKYKSDLYFNNNGEIETTKMLIRMKNIGFENQTRIARKLRSIFDASNFEGFIYEPSFLLVDQQVSTLHNILQNTGIAVGVMLLIALLFIPKLLTVLWIGISILSINAGVVGGLAFWGARLDIISMITIVMSVGFSVDFAAHITFHFLVNRGQDRLHRALRYVGTPILLSAASTVLGVLSLAPADSYMVRTFVKTVILVVTLGLLHGLVFLPVILSIFVPADQYLEAMGIYGVGTKVGHYLATNIPRYLGQIDNKRMRAYFTNTSADEPVTSEESLPDVHDVGPATIQDHLKDQRDLRNQLPPELHRSLPQIRNNLPRRKDRTRSQSVRNITVLYDFLKYKAELMNEESSGRHQEDIYSEVCDRSCHPSGCNHDFAPEIQDAPEFASPRHRLELPTEVHLDSLQEMDVHNFRNQRPVLQPSVFHQGPNRESARSSVQCPSVRELGRRNPERISNRMYLKRNETPRQSRMSSVSGQVHFPPPPRETQFLHSKKLPPMPACETVEIVLGSRLGSRSALKKSLSLENLDSHESLAASDAFDVFQRTHSGNFTKKQLSVAGYPGDLSTFKGASTVTECFPALEEGGSEIFGDQHDEEVLY